MAGLDMSAALWRWGRKDFKEMVESSLWDAQYDPYLLEALSPLCEDGGSVEDISGMAVAEKPEEPYDGGDTIRVNVLVDIVDSVRYTSEYYKDEPRNGILRLSIDKQTGEATVRECCGAEEDRM